ncbi:GFA family protein [Zavarzinia sp. CC-PAN008]|uniref:GFA family protein n=1 Tax=Zavarzinia sp. CC-PAN008 TaxID=3243332 RepID=UPI003F744137
MLRGRCACGVVTATFTGEPIATRQCWCRQCQQVAAGSATQNAIFRLADIAMTGDLATNAYVAASGNTLTHSFCGRCGTPVMAQSSARPQFRTIRLGFLEAGHGLVPSMAIWTDDAPDWAIIDPALERFARQPPLPPTT